MNRHEYIELAEKLKKRIVWSSTNGLTEEQIMDNRAIEQAIEVLKKEINP